MPNHTLYLSLVNITVWGTFPIMGKPKYNNMRNQAQLGEVRIQPIQVKNDAQRPPPVPFPLGLLVDHGSRRQPFTLAPRSVSDLPGGHKRPLRRESLSGKSFGNTLRRVASSAPRCRTQSKIFVPNEQEHAACPLVRKQVRGNFHRSGIVPGIPRARRFVGSFLPVRKPTAA
jgi:hypothetical protein